MTYLKYFVLAAVAAACAAPAAFGGSARGEAPADVTAKANIYLVAKKSFCTSTGISDVYTGDGKIGFFFTLRNSGRAGGKVNIVPVRHYDDGTTNESAMDMLIDVKVPARSLRRYRSPLYSYEAHNHEVVACGLKLDDRREVRIKVVRLK